MRCREEVWDVEKGYRKGGAETRRKDECRERCVNGWMGEERAVSDEIRVFVDTLHRKCRSVESAALRH